MATSFKARVNKLKNTRVSVSQKSEKTAPDTPLSSSIEEDTLKAWIHSTNNINSISNAITRIESDVNSVKSDRERVIKLEVELEKLMQLIANKDYFKNIFMEMLENMEPEPEKEEEPEWKNYIDNELNNLRSIFNTTHSSIKEMYENNFKKIHFLEEKLNLDKKVETKKEIDNLKDYIENQLNTFCIDYQEKINIFEENIEKRLDIYREEHNKNIHQLKIQYEKDVSDLKQSMDKQMVELQQCQQKDVSELKQGLAELQQCQQKDVSELKQSMDKQVVDLQQCQQKDASDLKKEIHWTNSELNALKQDYTSMVTTQKSFKNDIEILETFKNKQKKNNELIEENSDNLEKIKKENINFKNRVETIEKITKETSTIFVTKVADLADHTKKLDGRLGRCENYSKDLGISLGSVKELFDGERTSLSKIISNLKDDFVDLHERCDNTLSTLYRNDTQHIIDKYVFELSQLNLMFESSKTMQRENNYFKCIGNLSNRLDKIEQKIN